MLAALQSSRGI